jgi:hypothetical protein
VDFKSEIYCLAHAFIIANARLDKEPNYDAYRKGRKIRQVVQNLQQTTGNHLQNVGGIPDFQKHQEKF